MARDEIARQTKLAFEFVQKLYLETSYFVKEIEGTLGQEIEEFQILRASGYAISTTRSTGLEALYVEQWHIKKGLVFFAAKSDTELTRGVTVTKLSPGLKLIVVRFVLWDKGIQEPEVWAGTISDIVCKKDYSKFEHYMNSLDYYDKRAFQNAGRSQHEDNEMSITLNLIRKPLYGITNAEDIQREIVNPVLELYRGT